jgi:hypothetical protein
MLTVDGQGYLDHLQRKDRMERKNCGLLPILSQRLEYEKNI